MASCLWFLLGAVQFVEGGACLVPDGACFGPDGVGLVPVGVQLVPGGVCLGPVGLCLVQGVICLAPVSLCLGEGSFKFCSFGHDCLSLAIATPYLYTQQRKECLSIHIASGSILPPTPHISGPRKRT